MRFKILFTFYFLLFTFLLVFSYGFVDANFPLKTLPFLYDLIHAQRAFTTIIYIIVVASLFGVYGWVLSWVRKKKLGSREIWRLIGITAAILFFSFPAFSYDIFNYMATAKVAFFYQENPYLVMPIEFPGEPMLKFMHAANKIALYPPIWILLTAVPHFLGGGRIVLTVFTFKAFVVLFYLGLCWLIWEISERRAYSLAFFALNPLVVIETLVSGHNDVVMMFWAFLAIYLPQHQPRRNVGTVRGFASNTRSHRVRLAGGSLFQKKRILSFISLLVSIGIKYATVALLPLFVLAPKLKKEKLVLFSWWAMLMVFLLSPLREEIYSWYFIWVISFAALMPEKKFFFWLTMAFSLGLLLRHTPWLYFRSWGGITPMIKRITTFTPPAIVVVLYFLKKELRQS